MQAVTRNALTPLWQAALACPIHSSSCGCAVPSAVRIDPETLELDIMDYVEERYGLEFLPAWVEARVLRASTRASGFPDWLQSLGGTCLAAEVHASVVADVARTLRSMAEHAAGRLAPIGSLGSGWLGGGRI